jgi:hypothetical protein
MIDQAFIDFAIPFHVFFASPSVMADDFVFGIRSGIRMENTFQAELIAAVSDKLRIGLIEVAFAIGQVIHRIEYAGFPGAIRTCEGINAPAKLQV